MVGKWQERMKELQSWMRNAPGDAPVPIIPIVSLEPGFIPGELADGKYILILTSQSSSSSSSGTNSDFVWKYHSQNGEWKEEKDGNYEWKRILRSHRREKERKPHDGRVVRVSELPTVWGLVVGDGDDNAAAAAANTSQAPMELERSDDPDRIVTGDLTVGGNLSAALLQANKAVINGAIECESIVQRSDNRFKREVVRFTYEMQKLVSKHAYKYKLFPDQYTTMSHEGKSKYGIIAQDWMTDFPDLITQDEQGGLLFDHSGLVALHQEGLAMLYSKVGDVEKQMQLLAQNFSTLSLGKGYSQPHFTQGQHDSMVKLLLERLEEPISKTGDLHNIVCRINNPDTIQEWVEICVNVSNKANEENAVTGKPRVKPGPHFFKLYRSWQSSQKRVNGRDDPVPLRDYQLEAALQIMRFDCCLLVMPTGSGKTQVATYVMLNLVPPADHPEKCCLFIVQNSALVNQQQRAIRSMSPKEGPVWNVSVASGGGNRYINDERVASQCTVRDIICYSHILVVTAGLLNNEMEKLDWSRIPLVVLDETHNSRGNSPFSKLLKYIQTLGEKPKILGMTATPGARSSSKEKAFESIRTLGQRHGIGFELISISEQDIRLIGHIAKPNIERVLIKERSANALLMLEKLDNQVRTLRDEVSDLIRELGLRDNTDDEPGSLADFPNSENDAVKGSLFKWTKKVWRRLQEPKSGPVVDDEILQKAFVLKHLCELCLAAHDLNVSDIIELILEVIGKCLSRHWDSDILHMALTTVAECSEVQNPKIDALLKELNRQKDSGPTFKAIVRVETRMSARKLTEYLKRNHESRLLLGHGRRVNDETFALSEMRKSLDDFKHADANVLVSTSVVQEGIDVKACDLVICYDILGSSSGADFIQLSGRARKSENSRFVVFLKGPAEQIAFDIAVSQSENQELALDQF